MKKQTLIFELWGDDVNLFFEDGTDIVPGSATFDDLKACTGPGDAEPALRDFLASYVIRWRVFKDGEWRDADLSDKGALANKIYFDSRTPFYEDETLTETYMLWEAAHNITENQK